MWKKLLFLPMWFAGTLLLICGSIGTMYLNEKYRQEPLHAQEMTQDTSIPTFSDGAVKGISTTLEAADARPDIVARFLERHSSPLTPYDDYGKKIVEIADRYSIDYRLLPAIAMQESNLCKKIPEGTFNCLGFGIHERGTLGFESYEANFDRAARELKKNYIDRGLDTPEKIMRKYTPSSNGSWAASVNQWIVEMEYDSREKGKAIDQDADLLEYVKE